MRSLVRHVFAFLRPLGKRLSPVTLWSIFWPVAATRVAWALLHEPALAGPFARLPAPLRPGGKNRLLFWPALWLQQTLVRTARMLDRWPDAYPLPTWRNRFTIAGDTGANALLRAGTRPVILFGFHYGPVEMIADLLRTHGIPYAAVHGLSEASYSAHRHRLDRATDEAAGLKGVPRRFLPTQTRRMFTFLRRHRGVLGVAGSTFTGETVAVRQGEVGTRLAPGALRLAALTGAVVIPAMLQAKPWAKITLTLGPATDPADLSDPKTHQQSCEKSFGFFLSIAKESAGQIYPHFAEQITSSAAPT